MSVCIVIIYEMIQKRQVGLKKSITFKCNFIQTIYRCIMQNL